MGNLLNKSQEAQAFYWSLIVLGLTAFIINLITVLMFVRFRKKLLDSNHNRILCSMAVADALVGCFSTSLGVLLLKKSPMLAYKLAGNIPLFSSMFASVTLLNILTADRLMAVKKPFIFGSMSYRRAISKFIIVTWIVPLLISVQQSLILVYTSSMQELKIRSIFFAIFFSTGAVVLIVANGLLFIGLKEYVARVQNREKKSVHGETSFSMNQNSVQAAKPNQRGGKPAVDNLAFKDTLSTLRETDEQNSVDKKKPTQARQNLDKERKARLTRRQELRRTSIICILIVVLFILTWIPLAGYRLTYAVGIKLGIPWLRRLALCLTIGNSILNPFIYFLLKKEFRDYLIELILFR